MKFLVFSGYGYKWREFALREYMNERYQVTTAVSNRNRGILAKEQTLIICGYEKLVSEKHEKNNHCFDIQSNPPFRAIVWSHVELNLLMNYNQVMTAPF